MQSLLECDRLDGCDDPYKFGFKGGRIFVSPFVLSTFQVSAVNQEYVPKRSKALFSPALYVRRVSLVCIDTS
jgi:hypothetical protein